jgi:hypothetical protein
MIDTFLVMFDIMPKYEEVKKIQKSIRKAV